GGVDWPAVVLDEPVLGHDAPSAARALVRLLRLRRQAEALRWFRFVREGGFTFALHTDPLAHDLEKLVTQDDVASFPSMLPAQIIIASHHTAALTAPDGLSGVVEFFEKHVDGQLKEQAERIKKQWYHRDVVRKVQDLLARKHEHDQAAKLDWPVTFW